MADNGSILIVEDEKIISSHLASILEHYHYQVAGIEMTGEGAIEKAGKLRPDLVLMDLWLAGEMDGIEASRKIKHQFDIPVIFVTALFDEKMIEPIKRADACGYILKPFNDEHLRVTIELAMYKHKTELDLKKSEFRYRDLVERAGIAILMDNIEGELVYYNKHLSHMFGYTMGEMKGKNIRELVHRDDIPKMMRLHDKRVAGIGPAGEYMIRGICKSGKTIFLEVNCNMFKEDGQISGTRAYLKDITERVEAEKRVADQNKALQNLSILLLKSQEEERLRLSRELHDEMGQMLTALTINLSAIRQVLPDKNDSQVLNRMEESLQIVDEMSSQVHELILDLRPGMLDHLGLIPTLRWHLDRFQERTHIRVYRHLPSFAGRLSGDYEIVIYRLIQEALNNVAKHASAETVRLIFRKTASKIQISIEDDGVGLDMENMRHQGDSQGTGLPGMRERLVSVKGQMEIQAEKNKGTRLSFTIPYREK